MRWSIVFHIVLTVEASTSAAPTVSITANSNTINDGSSSNLTVIATNSTSVKVTGSDGNTYIWRRMAEHK